jgi:hypothetical protein
VAGEASTDHGYQADGGAEDFAVAAEGLGARDDTDFGAIC